MDRIQDSRFQSRNNPFLTKERKVSGRTVKHDAITGVTMKSCFLTN